MRTLLDDHYAPITRSIGFVRAEIDDVEVAVVKWKAQLGLSIRSEPIVGLESGLRTLPPLVAGIRPRMLLISHTSEWTAYFDCLLTGTDAVSAVAYLARTLGVPGVAVTAVPDTAGLKDYRHGQFGGVSFELFGPEGSSALNSIRSIAAINNGGRWVFVTGGTEQPFETRTRYLARKIRNRFTSDMAEDYCRALGIQVFDPSAYGPRGIVLHSDDNVPAGALSMSLEEAQHWHDIRPGEAHAFTG